MTQVVLGEEDLSGKFLKQEFSKICAKSATLRRL